MDGLISKVGVVADGLKRMSKMVITSVCGAAAGAGVSLALGGDFMICADNAKFILPLSISVLFLTQVQLIF